ncbi:MAG: hypothetical protein HOK92_06615 [Flavobacteriales bacterium]|nr:hypothetical protein [Flavobacteriales bacterium]
MESNYVSLYDISIATLWLIILLVITNSRSRKVDGEIRKYYMRNVLFKFFFAIAFAVVYLIYYGGGDTTAYWDGAITLNKLFIESPSFYFENLMSEPSSEIFSKHFNVETGYPPGWLYKEPEAWFVCKIASIISFITFKSYFAATIFFAFLTAMASWRVFEMIVKLGTHKTNIAALCILFVPSVSFWCTGISKDSLVFISILNLLYFVFNIMVLRNAIKLKHVLIILLSIFLIYHVRSFILAAIAAPIFMSFGARLTKRYEKQFLTKLLFRSFIFLGGIFLFVQFFSSSFSAEMVAEAELVQSDFTNNQTYTGKRYEISNTDASPAGLIRAVPESVFYGIYRPFIYESFSPTLIVNGIESLVLMILTIRFFISKDLFSKIKYIRKEEILVFAFIFALFIAFMSGFTSVLFGVLVRIRAPLLPFFFLVLTANVMLIENKNNVEK